jgi:glycosyltransferase involved in cell wall biosynthesis
LEKIAHIRHTFLDANLVQLNVRPRVTIVIPTYNGSRFLRQAIDSVLGQIYPNIELIVLDDGSTDDTRAVLEHYDNGFFWERHANMGQAATLNKGWRMAEGEILSYLSADDILLPMAVHSAVQYMIANASVVLTYCAFNLIDPYSRIIRKVTPPDFDYLQMVRRLICPPGPGVFFRKWAFERIGGWDHSLRQMPDFDYWLRLGSIGPFARIPEVLASFRIHDRSMTFSRVNRQRAAEPVRIMEKYYRNPNALPAHIVSAFPDSMSNAHLIAAQLHLRSGRFADALSALRVAATYSKNTVLSSRNLRLLLNAVFNRLFHRILWRLRRTASATPLSTHI